MQITNKSGAPIETKPVAALSTNAIIGYIVALVFVLWPSLASKIPQDMQLQLPVVIGTVLGAVAAYYSKHTSRPDLSGAVQPFNEAELEQIRYMMAQRQPEYQPGIPASSAAHDVIGNQR